MRREISWLENNQKQTRAWISEGDFSAPKEILLADDFLKADTFYQKSSNGAAFLWRGDFQNAKMLLSAVNRRIEKKVQSKAKKTNAKDELHGDTNATMAQAFHRHRQGQAHRSQLLNRLLICVEKDFSVDLRRAPDAKAALENVLGKQEGNFVISLRELLGYIGAYEWQKKGVSVPALGRPVFPHYGVFAPVRGEYLELIEKAPLPAKVDLAFDIGTGTGVLAAILARRGANKIIATDIDTRAVICARENLERLNLQNQVEVLEQDLFPAGKADLIVCNPPWVPARPTSRLERAIFDEGNQMLKSFLNGVGAHLNENAQAWLVLSDLAEHLGLRKAGELESWIAEAGLQVVEVLKTKPRHPKSNDVEDALSKARANEVTCLWRLSLV